MNSFKRKILLIGLDGASWDIYNEILSKGYMPYLKLLKDKGNSGILYSTIPPISPAAWATIQTGRKALNDQIYEFYTFNKNTKIIQYINSNFLKNTTWEILSKVGKKVAVVNVPMTYPPKKVNGYIISGILTPSLDSNFTYPPYLRDYILKKIPDYQLHYSEDVRYGSPHYDIKNFVEQRIKNIKDRTKVCVWLLNNFKIDILMVNFQANDILQHVLWNYMKNDNKLYNEGIKFYIFQHFHKMLDFCIETIREEFIRNSDGELLTIVLSDHGCESHFKRFYLGDWLQRENFLKIKISVIKLLIRRKLKDFFLRHKIANTHIKILNLLKNLEVKFNRKSKSEQETNILQNIVDWENSYAFSMGISLYGLIFILKHGEERVKIMENLKKRLYLIKDPENGEHIVENIYGRDEIYNGNHPELVPDLIIKPKKGYSFTGLFQNKNNLFEKIDKNKDFALGKHSEEGILVMHGPNFKENIINNANLEDILPTILKYFNLPVSDDLEGKVLADFKS